MPERSARLTARLSGGDRRSIGGADDVARDIEHGLVDVVEVVKLMTGSDDPIIAMRAADAVEKATRGRPELLEPVRGQLLDLLEVARQQELRWHLAQIAPRLELSAGEADRVVAILEDYLHDTSSIVKTEALQALVDLARASNRGVDRVLRLLDLAATSGTPAMQARARKLRSTLLHR